MPKSPSKKVTKASSSKPKPTSLEELINEESKNATRPLVEEEDKISIHSEGPIIEQAKIKLKNLEQNANVDEAEFNADLEKQTAYR